MEKYVVYVSYVFLSFDATSPRLVDVAAFSKRASALRRVF